MTTATNSSFLLIFASLPQSHLSAEPRTGGRILAEQLFDSIEFCLTPTSNNNISPRFNKCLGCRESNATTAPVINATLPSNFPICSFPNLDALNIVNDSLDIDLKTIHFNGGPIRH